MDARGCTHYLFWAFDVRVGLNLKEGGEKVELSIFETWKLALSFYSFILIDNLESIEATRTTTTTTTTTTITAAIAVQEKSQNVYI